MKKCWLFALVAFSALGAGACADESSDEGMVARVAGYDLTVDDLAELLVDEEQIPADRGLLERVADLWVDYVLLGAATARDSTFADIDFEPLVRRQLEQVMIFQLRDSVIQADTVISDADLRALFEAEDGAMEIRARHILLGIPAGATVSDRQAVITRMEQIKAQIDAGADFQAAAQSFSQDGGTAPRGGDLGFFGLGDMFPEFEAAVVALEPGEVSDPVMTQVGVHLIQLVEKRLQGFEEVAEGLRARVQTRRFLQAESTYVASVEERAAPEVQSGAVDIVRELASDPGAQMSARAARRALMTYTDGSLSITDVREILKAQTPGFLVQVAEGEDDEIERFLQGLVQRKLLTAEATAAGFGPSQERVDSLVSDARAQLRAASSALGILNPDRAPGEDLEPALERAVLEALERIVAGGVEVVELGPIAYQLREGQSPVVSSEGIGQSVLLIGQRRANRSASILEDAADGTQAPDSIGG